MNERHVAPARGRLTPPTSRVISAAAAVTMGPRRFHFVDAIKSVGPGVAILVIAGAPGDVMAWLSALTGYIGMMTHTNAAMRFGPLSYLFNTPELHRWHHSRDLREGNKNYGENIVLWDLVFGTYFNAARRPPADIGISEIMPPRFRDQVIWPFRRLLERRRTDRFAGLEVGPAEFAADLVEDR